MNEMALYEAEQGMLKQQMTSVYWADFTLTLYGFFAMAWTLIRLLSDFFSLLFSSSGSVVLYL